MAFALKVFYNQYFNHLTVKYFQTILFEVFTLDVEVAFYKQNLINTT